MSKIMPSLTTLAALLALGLAVVPAHAQQSRSFVSGAIGNDANAPNCMRNAPCRTFQVAHDNTIDKGEVTVLDPGSYGAVSITKNISIINDGVGEAGVLVSGSGTGIIIDAPSTAAVTLRGLTIKGIGFGGGIGLTFVAGAALNVENCTIRNLDTLGTGIFFGPGAGTTNLQITNTVVTDNSVDGIVIFPGNGNATVNVVLDHVGLYNNGNTGLRVASSSAGGGINATVTDSVASNNGMIGSGAGFLAMNNLNTAPVFLFLNRTVVVNNPDHGIVARGPGVSVYVNQTVVSRNASGWVDRQGARIFTYGNNSVVANDSNEAFQTPVLAK